MIDKETANYREAPAGAEKRCGTCSMFRARFHTCTLVKGRIEAEDVCDRYEPKK